MVGRPCYEVEFSDGTVLIADAEHQWLTETRASRKSALVRTTRDIAETLLRNHAVANSKPPLQAADRPLHVPPYTLGVWLGQGMGPAEPEIVMRVEGEGSEIGALKATQIPAEYLRASEAQRRAVLGGLLDASGVVSSDGSVDFFRRLMRAWPMTCSS